MRKFLKVITVVLAMLVMVSVAFGAGIRERIWDQQKRIDSGIASGQLTRHEADILLDNLSWIRYEFARLTDDGKLSPGERDRLDKMLDRNDNMIINKKQNPVTVFYKKKIGIGGVIPDRIKDQQVRIDQGIRSRALTRAEADILIDNLNRIRDEFHRFKRDGKLTWREADRMDRMLDRNSEMIYAKKHNSNVRIAPLDFKLFLNVN
jgi:dsDNA-binding SOS-regulon protein